MQPAIHRAPACQGHENEKHQMTRRSGGRHRAALGHPASGQNGAQEAPPPAPFGEQADMEFSKKLWTALKELRLVGDGRIQSFPYDGTEPHGKLLQTFKAEVEVDGRTSQVWVKNNDGGENLTKTDVLTDPEKHLGAIAVMVKREDGL
jgi:hypothetical protein